MKLILDSGSDLVKKDGDNFEVVSLQEDSWVSNYKKAIGDAKDAIIIPVASKLSESFNAAMKAAGECMKANKGSKIKALDSKAVGPGQKLIVEKFNECEADGKNIDDTFEELEEYSKNHLRMGFSLSSFTNLANARKIPMAIAKLASSVGTRISGILSEWGEIQPIKKSKDETNAVEAIFEEMKEAGYKGSKAIIDHCDAENFAKALAERIKAEFSNADIRIAEATDVVSFYAERGGVVVGYEV